MNSGPQGKTPLTGMVMVKISGPLVLDWQGVVRPAMAPRTARREWKPATHFGLPRLPKVPATGPGLGRVAYADARQHRDILQSLIRALNSGKHRIWLATPYFLPTWGVRRALRRAAGRGVDVRLLLTGPRTDHPSVRYAGHRYYPAPAALGCADIRVPAIGTCT